MASHSSIGPIEIHLPSRVETIDDLAREFPNWDVEMIREKTGVRQRHLAGPDECASDLGVAAATQLFAKYDIDPQSIDFLLFCTQSPDYPLPTTACLVQNRLGLRTTCGALDFNLGCSGFIYGLSVADGLIRSGTAKRILLITAETYSKYIHPADRSLRTIFGDAAAATLVMPSEAPSLSDFTFGTDGSYANALLVNTGGARPVEHAIKPRTKWRWPSRMYMDGPGLITLTMDLIPKTVQRMLASSGWNEQDINLYIMHQPTRKLLDELRKVTGTNEERMPTILEEVGNTVSSTIPIAISELRKSGRLHPGSRSAMIGFGVGFSWAGCLWQETWGQ